VDDKTKAELAALIRQEIGALQGGAGLPLSVAAGVTAGLGAGPQAVANGGVGVGCGPGSGTCDADVMTLLLWGAPVLAYARAKGIPLAPEEFKVEALFEQVSQVLVSDAGNSQKLVTPTIVDEIHVQVDNQNTPSGLDSLTNFFFSYQSGIEAKMKAVGTPRYSIGDDFIPIKAYHRCYTGWILERTNGIKMDFTATILPLPFAPILVTFTFHGRTAYWKKLFLMRDDQALQALKDCGYDVSCYENIYC
jgi:hypothetical protein